jgi:hypothetical protein
MKTKPDPLDVVELLAIEALVEIANEHGRTIELLNVPYEALRIRESEPTRRRPPDNPAARGNYSAG